ncbi:hypothetical protein RTBOTA2_004764 [Rhodotorula toruloides]|nr:hypothetical protein RTBOTA2_004764 [Rhodotorula toruloides]PRQ75965.1 hypothetical protein AAT19DRAFT_12987 [Rhodotorula toruloides]
MGLASHGTAECAQHRSSSSSGGGGSWTGCWATGPERQRKDARSTCSYLQYSAEALRTLTELFAPLPSPVYFSIAQCSMFLSDRSLAHVAKLDLHRCKPPKDDTVLTAYRIAFDLAETASQEFLQVVRTSVAESKPEVAEVEEGAVATEEAKPKEGAV